MAARDARVEPEHDGSTYVSLSSPAGISIETSRLILRRPTLSDVPRLFEILGDAVAMRYTHVDASLRHCRRRVAGHEWQRRRSGYAPWTVVTKIGARIIGWGGLYDDPFDPGWGVEIGYFFEPAVWGQGYATELTSACTAFAANVLRLPETWAFAEVRFVPEIDRLLYRHGRQDQRLESA